MEGVQHDHDGGDAQGLLILADKGYIAAELDRFLAAHGISLLRPSYRNRGIPRPGEALLKTVRQLIAKPDGDLDPNALPERSRQRRR
ncbi:hypothetical protein [Streptomyces sp. TRM72054]|uniref:hypothetical protein n=1 Tax=Streptomyces sp. TRM72054 TaxID=2870562 RepID=UPI0021AB5E18|nr:hypothetical protein [Streptomyces sp. TRM72054]